MTLPQDPNNDGLKTGDEVHGYKLQRVSRLADIDGYFYLLVHQVTGARHVHISNQDKDNTFGVAFKTVPTDSTGVAHILEHTVLCGSRNYPVRDPFFSMLKRSLSTFMNAFTASDWTMYPFSTQNRKDYYNLLDVYLDAAFFPKLDKLSFKQEGHRLEIEAPAAAQEQPTLVYKGVVYNEMKGAMSSPDQVMARSMLNALYPDTTYSNNSGGDPAQIPRLTHAQLIEFHRRHYHPSNAYFYTYGNLPLKEHLAFIDRKILSQYGRIDPGTDVPAQTRWPSPRDARYAYPLAPEEDAARKCQVSLAWLTCDIRDTFEVLVLSILEQVLLGNAASPLRKALMDSGLGSTLSDGSGYDADNRDTLFACGLKDTAESAAGEIERIIISVLEQSARDGLAPELIESAIHQIEFHRKEVTNTPYPYGIKLLLRVVGSWLHGGDPERILQLDADFEHLRKEIAAGRFLENRIRQYFLDNSHRVRLVLTPDRQKAQQEEQRIRQELAALWVQLDESAKGKIEADATALKKRQESPENSDVLPTLTLDDIPPQITSYAPTDMTAEIPLWRYKQPTSGIFYFNAAATASAVSEELLPWVPFFCYAFSKCGTRQHDYTQIARRIDAVTGGVGLSAQARVLYHQNGACLPLVQLGAKCLGRNIDPMYALVEELVAEAEFRNYARLKQLLGEYRSALEAMIVHNGHRLAITLSSRTFSAADALSEIWSGVHQIRTLRLFNAQMDDQRVEELAGWLEKIGQAVFTRENVLMAAIGDHESVEQATGRISGSPPLAAFKRGQQDARLSPLDLKVAQELPFEGWSTSTAVAFVAQTLPAVRLGQPDAPVLAVLSKLLRSLYLHREIREKGGAYGGFALYNPESGLFNLASYRDPHIVQTLKVFAGVTDFIRNAPISDDDIKEAVLQVCSEIDKPDPPGPAARKAFLRMIVGLTDEDRLAYKQQLLEVTRERVLAATGTYFADAAQRSGIAVIAGQAQFETANAQFKDRKLKIHAI